MEPNVPNWLGPLLVFCGLAGFVGYAFRQGTKVKPDKDSPPFGSGHFYGSDGSHNGSDGSHPGSDGSF
jgi:hypothetical protein